MCKTSWQGKQTEREREQDLHEGLLSKDYARNHIYIILHTIISHVSLPHYLLLIYLMSLLHA